MVVIVIIEMNSILAQKIRMIKLVIALTGQSDSLKYPPKERDD